MITVTNLTGSGTFDEDKIISYSYSEDASPYQPENLEGGAGQVTVNVIADENPRGTPIITNNNIQVTDSEFGSVTFRARQVTISDASATISGETIQYRLNSTRQAAARGGSGTTLLEAILYYCELVDVVPEFEEGFETKLQTIEVNFPGWNGNVWEHLKMLCAATSLDADDNTFMEMYILQDKLWFREGNTQTIDFSDYVINQSLSLDSYDAAKEVEVFNYNTSYGVNKVVREQGKDINVSTVNKNASISDSMQVEAGETLVKRFSINASLTSVQQPVVVGAISPLPFPDTDSTGQYVVVGSDDLPIDPIQWIDQGGRLEVRLTENYDEIEVIITAPPSLTMPTADGDPEDVTLAPYKIGVESSGGVEYPAIYIVGTGVFFEKTSLKLVTGASEDYVSDTSAPTVDNPFITNKRLQLDKGVAAAQAIMGPRMEVQGSIATGVSFGESLGSIMQDYNGKFRLSSLSYSDSSISFTARRFMTISDFNTAWAGATLEQFNTANGQLSFDEFAAIPLVRN
jgi:hypothetical protein